MIVLYLDLKGRDTKLAPRQVTEETVMTDDGGGRELAVLALHEELPTRADVCHNFIYLFIFAVVNN